MRGRPLEPTTTQRFATVLRTESENLIVWLPEETRPFMPNTTGTGVVGFTTTRGFSASTVWKVLPPTLTVQPVVQSAPMGATVALARRLMASERAATSED